MPPNVDSQVESLIVPPTANAGCKDCEIEMVPTRKTVVISMAENFVVIKITT